VRTSDVKRRNLFIYPDYRDGWFSWAYHSDYFFQFLKKNDLLRVLYPTGNDLQAIHFWVAKAFEWKTQISPWTYSNPYPLSDSTLRDILDFVDTHSGGKDFDRNLLRLVLANRAFENGDTTEGFKQYGLLDLQNFRSTATRYEYLEKGFISNMMNQLAVHLAGAGKISDALVISRKFEGNREKALSYFSIAERLYRNGPDARAFDFIDSAYQVNRKIDYSVAVAAVDPRYFQIQLLSEIGSRSINREAADILRDLPEGGKYGGVFLRVAGLAYEGNYYQALTAIPGTLTESQDLQCRTFILIEACRARERKANDKSWQSMDQYLDWGLHYNDYYPN
jgi:hypothetical protein